MAFLRVSYLRDSHLRTSHSIIPSVIFTSVIVTGAIFGIRSAVVPLEQLTKSIADPIYIPRPQSPVLWRNCDSHISGSGISGSDCAQLKVPLDYAHRNAGTIRIGISRLKAINSQQRIGTLFVNAGGPGATGDEGLQLVSDDDFSEIREHFDIIGFDPRGVAGRGDKLQCPQLLEDPHISMIPSNSWAFSSLANHNHNVGLACKQATGPLIDHVDTRSVIDDIDSIRAALREKTISYYGVSYGTEIGQLYAEKYPTHLRAITLDGNMDHAEDGWTIIQQEARSEENTLQFFTQLCSADPQCTVPNHDVIANFNHVIDDADNGKLYSSNGERISARKITKYLYNNVLLTPHKLKLAYEQAHLLFTEDPVTLDKIVEPESLAYTIVSCHDTIKHSPSFAEFNNWITQLKAIAPHMYRFTETLSINAACVNWPIPAQDPPTPLHIHPDLPVLLVANRIDPSTPLTGSISLHHLIAGSRLVTTNAVGHTANGNSHCGRAIISFYLLSAHLPQTDQTCTG